MECLQKDDEQFFGQRTRRLVLQHRRPNIQHLTPLVLLVQNSYEMRNDSAPESQGYTEFKKSSMRTTWRKTDVRQLCIHCGGESSTTIFT